VQFFNRMRYFSKLCENRLVKRHMPYASLLYMLQVLVDMCVQITCACNSFVIDCDLLVSFN
jgi:hypothetical protein